MCEFTFKGIPIKLVLAEQPGTCNGCIVDDYFGETAEGLCNFCDYYKIFVNNEDTK